MSSPNAPDAPEPALAQEPVADPTTTAPEDTGGCREVGELPFPKEKPGTANPQMPFDHLVVIMMENHSFDNLLGALHETRSEVDGLTFNAAGEATNWNPGSGATPAEVRSFPFANTAQAKHVSQSWKATHEQIDSGAMDGFVRSVGAQEPMGYYTKEVLPFAYSFANAFTLANQWFCSVPGPTYPNRRFMLAGTAYGSTVTDFGETLLEGPPPHGTIMDQLSKHNVSWANYFTDVPMTSVIPSSVVKHLDRLHLMSKFFHDCKAGSLPSVSFVDPGIGAFSSIAKAVASLPGFVKDALRLIGADIAEIPPAETEEDPGDMYEGELWAFKAIDAVLKSPAWERTLIIYTYDEHGGYYDHVAPPDAPAPDDIAPKLQPGEAADGGYSKYGLRVPAIVASPYSKPGGVTNMLHDHTSILATIEHKWNLPALTERDSQAATVMDFLGTEPLLKDPPTLVEPPDSGPAGPASSI